jgi:hypothetical protein
MKAKKEISMQTKLGKITSVLVTLCLLTAAAVAQCGSIDKPHGKLKPQAWYFGGGSIDSLLRVADGDNRADEGAGIVGFWRVTLTSKGNTGLGIPDGAQLDHGFAQWHSDGTEIMNSNRQPSTGSFCLGVWKKVGPSKYVLNHFAMGFDDTIHQSYSNIREEVVLSQDGDSFSGTFTIAIYDLAGNPGPVITGEITGTRVKVTTTVQDIL